MVRYRFSAFTLSPQQRLLIRDGQEVPLIPRYFDLLLLLIERRHEAVHRREIFDRVWGEVTVSDSALSQAIRTIRSTLGDDSRDPRFIRTVSRHGYRFVFPDVIEEDDQTARVVGGATSSEVLSQGSANSGVAIAREPVSPGGTLWSGAAAGSALAGVTAGGIGGLMLAAAPGSSAPLALAPVLAVIGGVCGALGGAGVGAGLGFADRSAAASRSLLLIVTAAAGGGIVGVAVQWLTRWGLSALVGVDVAVGGGLEGLVIGGAAGLAIALATHDASDGLAASLGRRGLMALALLALACGLAGLSLTLTGHPLVGGTIHAIADAADGSRATLAPLGRLIGEPDFGPVSSAILAFAEGALFGLGLGWGIRRQG